MLRGRECDCTDLVYGRARRRDAIIIRDNIIRGPRIVVELVIPNRIELKFGFSSIRRQHYPGFTSQDIQRRRQPTNKLHY